MNMRTQGEYVVVSGVTETYEKDGQKKRFDVLYLLEPPTGQVLEVRPTSDSLGVYDTLKKAGFGARATVVLDVRAWARGTRAEMSFTLVDATVTKSSGPAVNPATGEKAA